jgi:tetratricopeptide (TPR) repeat protein
MKTEIANYIKKGFSACVSEVKELSDLRSEYASKPFERREAAEWSYTESLVPNIFTILEHGFGQAEKQKKQKPKWPPGFIALAIDPGFAPALLTVGSYEYQCKRRSEGLNLLFQLVRLPPDTHDLIPIIDKAGQFLVNENDIHNASKLFDEALHAMPDSPVLMSAMAWALCKAGKQAEALQWYDKILSITPNDSPALSDYGWTLVELNRFDEAKVILEKAVQFASPDYVQPANNLNRLRHLQQAHLGKKGLKE